MIRLRVEPDGVKRILITGIDPVVLDCLQALPEILEQRDTPAARKRLLPDPTPADVETNEEWQRTIVPDLRHLFVSATDTVVRDLTAVESAGQLSEVAFPAEHLAAWMSALNQSRLILGELFKITDADMETREFDVTKPKGLAILRIHVLGYLLQLLIELEAGREPQTSV